MRNDGAVEFRGTDRFRIHRRLGAGGMGVVYEAFDSDRNDRVALKTLHRIEPQALYRLKQEFRALQGLEHPNLVSLGELIESDGQWFFTMELVDGVGFLDWVRTAPLETGIGTLETAEQAPLARTRPPARASAAPGGRRTSVGFDDARLRAALAGLVAGLHALHQADKVHRDVKPSNILIDGLGRVVLLDFGLTAERAAESSAEAQVVGTAAYMAPEQAAGRPAGPEADWYSVGVLLYQALTGRLPFTGSSLEIMMAKQEHEPPPPHTLISGLPTDLDALCADLLRFEPAERPTGRELIDRLGIAGTAAVTATGSFGSSTRVFVGRQRELETLQAAFDAAGDAPVELYLHGESGIGKSALIRAFLDRVERQRPDAVVLRGRCYEREQVPYKALDGVIDALSRYLRRRPTSEVDSLLPDHADLLPLLFPVLGRIEAIAQAPHVSSRDQDPNQLRSRVFRSLRALFQRLADRHPVVVVIDDLQWADADSEVLLTDLLRPPDAPPMLLLASSRTPRRAGFAGPADGDRVQVVELAPLPADVSRELTRALLARAGVAATGKAELISADAHGHPLFIDELVRHAATTGTGDYQGLRLDEAIWSRISQLPAQAGAILQLISVAGAPISYDVCQRAAQIPPADFNRRLGLLRAANLVRRTTARRETFEPYHNRIRDAVLGHLDDDTARAHHTRLAVALESAPPETVRPQLILHHLESAGQAGKAAEYAAVGARRASAAFAFDQAAELYGAALRIGDDPADKRRQLRIARAEALANAGRGLEAADAFLAAADGADPVTRSECQRRAAAQLLITGHLERGVETLDTLLQEAHVDLPRSPRKALFALLRHRIRLRLRGLRYSPRHEREIADAELTRLDIFQVVGDGMAMVDNISGALFQTRSLLLALELGEKRRIAHALAMESVFVGSQGGRALRRARVLVDQLQRMAEGSDDPWLRAYAVGGAGVWRYLSGEFGPGAELLRDAERTLAEETAGTQMELNNTRLFHLFCLRHLGSVARCTELFQRYVRDAERRGDLYAETTFRRSCSRVWLAQDDPARAHSDLDQTSWTAPEDGFHFQHWYELEARAELALYEQQVAARADDLEARFHDLSRSLLTRIQIVRTSAWWLWGRFQLGLTGDPSRRAAALKRAARLGRQLRREPIDYARTWGQLLGAAVDQGRQRPDRAVAELRAAAEAAERCQMHLVAACARRRLGGLLGGDDGDRELREADAWLAGEGVRNPARFTDMMVPMPAASDVAGE
jgi:hypothetical protein